MMQKNEKVFKSRLSNIKTGNYKSDKQLSEINIIANFYHSREDVTEFFKDSSRILNNTIYNIKYRKELQILTPKQML